MKSLGTVTLRLLSLTAVASEPPVGSEPLQTERLDIQIPSISGIYLTKQSGTYVVQFVDVASRLENRDKPSETPPEPKAKL